jgi:hypothetical protein
MTAERESRDTSTQLPVAPTFVVAGAGRAGTTGLVEGLRSHPDVFVTDPKEPHYFALHATHPSFRGPGDERAINRAAITDKDDYLALYPQGSRFRALGEGSVSTLYYHDRAVPEMLRLNPNIKAIVLLREPVERAYSSFQYLRASGREPSADFLAAVAEEPARKADNWHHLWHYTSMSRYGESLRALQTQLQPGHVGVWFFDELEQDYAGTYQDILRFLDLPVLPGMGEAVPRVNASGSPRSPFIQQAVWWAQRHPRLQQGVRTVSTWRLREAVKTRLLSRGSVPPAVRRQLQPVFDDDRREVRRLLAEKPLLPSWLTA